ncbi:hypothetical protein ACWC5I_03310 [Kitasatospora sp. NPDC001574]
MTTTSTPATALAVGVHHHHDRQRLLLRLPDGDRAVSLPLADRDADRIPQPASTALMPLLVVRWLIPPLAVSVQRAAGGLRVIDVVTPGGAP